MAGHFSVAAKHAPGLAHTVDGDAVERRSPAPTESNTMTSPLRESKKLRVLVMDDDRLVRAAFVRGLNRYYELVEASSGEEALELLLASGTAGQTFDAIVADLTLPGMDGVTFFEEVSVRFPELASRVLFVTGGSTSARAELFLRETHNEVLLKPVLHERLRLAIEKVVERCSAQISVAGRPR